MVERLGSKTLLHVNIPEPLTIEIKGAEALEPGSEVLVPTNPSGMHLVVANGWNSPRDAIAWPS